MNAINEEHARAFADRREYPCINGKMAGLIGFAPGMRVMATLNDYRQGIENGGQGVITRLYDDSIGVAWDDGGESIVRPVPAWRAAGPGAGSEKVFPLTLAYAITIHKSQGRTYDAANIDTQGIHGAGMLYVALSRCRTPEQAHLLHPVNEDEWIVSSDAVTKIGAA